MRYGVGARLAAVIPIFPVTSTDHTLSFCARNLETTRAPTPLT